MMDASFKPSLQVTTYTLSVINGSPSRGGVYQQQQQQQLQETELSPTGSALARTDLSPLTNGNWVIHAEYSCFLHPPFLAKIGYIP